MTKTKILAHKDYLAFSLTSYARRNERFKKELERLVSIFLPKKETEVVDYAGNIEIILPKDEQTATKRALWLINNNSESAKDILRSAAETEPKAIVVGIVGVAIPGPTLGYMKKFNKMSVIVSDQKTGRDKTIARAVADLILKAIRQANNDLSKIEPEMGDWLFGDKEIEIYSAKNTDSIKRDLNGLKIPYSQADDVLAISPVLNLDLANWPIELAS